VSLPDSPESLTPSRQLLVDLPESGKDGPTGTVWLGVKLMAMLVSFGLAIIVGLTLTRALAKMPNIAILDDYQPSQSTQIYDRYNNLIANLHGDEDRVVVPLNDISLHLQRAVLATEDNRFYEHHGVDIKGTARAFLVTSSGGRMQGGSSITQQLVKNIFLTPERSIMRKFAEALLAVKVEGRYDKQRILELYLNQVYFGNLSYGAEKAARRYFKCSAKQLSLAQAAMLAGLLQAPEAMSPYRFPDVAKARQKEVLDNMLEYGYITAKQRTDALKEPLTLNSRAQKTSKYPYYVAYVIQELESRYGRKAVRQGGLKVYTSMDPVSQLKAQELVDQFIKRRGYSGVKQGAIVTLDVATGEVLALVGGTDYEHNQYNAATQARRAVGSTFKPFVFLTGFRLEKMTPKTPICDRPIRYGDWSPHNWDNQYMGCMNIRRALVLSRNTTTVQIGMKVGVEEVLETAKRAGVKSPIDPNPSSFLGSSGVSPLELVTAYSTIARGGVYIPAKSILKVADNRGNLIRVEEAPPRRTFKQDHVAALVDILIDVVNQGTGQNARLSNRVVAGKTGTTDKVKDIWFMGFTSDMVTGVWFGNTRNVPLHGVFSSDAAAVWHQFAVHFYKEHPRPETPFFLASDEYAAKSQLVHLMDPKGVAEARKRLGALALGSEVTFGAEGGVPSTATATVSNPANRIQIQEDPAAAGFSVKVDGQAVSPSGGGNGEVRPSELPTQPPSETPPPTPAPPTPSE
jgi:penicillin-binding protein 1A